MPEDPHDRDDAHLLALVVARRPEAFETLYARHAAAVTAVVWRACGDRTVTAEIVQTTFLRLWERAGTLAAPNLRLRAWLITVGRNALADRRRRQRVTAVPIDEAAAIAAASATEDEVMADFSRRDVRRALAQLPDDQRTAIELAFFGGLTQVEIAAALDAPLGTVKGRVRLGLKKLRESLATLEGEPA